MSNEFSAYALIYEDTAAVVDAGTDDNPRTNVPLAGMGVFAAMSFFVAVAAYTAKKRKNK